MFVRSFTQNQNINSHKQTETYRQQMKECGMSQKTFSEKDGIALSTIIEEDPLIPDSRDTEAGFFTLNQENHLRVSLTDGEVPMEHFHQKVQYMTNMVYFL